MFAYVFLFLVNSFYSWEFFQYSMVISIFIIFLVVFPDVKNSNKLLAMALFILGAYILIKSNAGLKDLLRAFTENAGIITLLLTVPLLSIILHYDNYAEGILELAEKYITSNFSFYTITVFIVNGLGMILNLATIPLVYQLMEKTSQYYPQKLYYKALTRGFCTNLMWSPNFISVAVVLHYLKIPWYKIAPLGLLLAIVGNLLGIVIERLSRKEPDVRLLVSSHKEGTYASRKRYSYKLIGLIAFFIFYIILLELCIDQSVLVTVPLVSFTAPLILALILKKMGIFKEKFRDYLHVSLPGMHNEVFLFTAIGFLGYALRISNIGQYIVALINRLGFNSASSLIPLLLTVIALLSLIGVHPIISISTVAVTLPVGTLPLTELQMAVTLLAGYLLYLILSPFSALSLIMTGITKESPLEVSIKLNFAYGVSFAVVTSLILSLL